MTGPLQQIIVLAAAVALGGSLAACGEAAPATGAGSGDGGAPALGHLAGRTFTGGPAQPPLVPGSTVTLRFSEAEVGAHAGCNHLSGEARLDDGRLVVPALGGTEMGCDPALMEQDAWLAELLTSRPMARLENGRLTVTGDGTSLVLAEGEEAAAPLEGTTWRLDGLVTGSGPDGTVGSVPAGVRGTTLRIADGLLEVGTGCNEGSGRVVVGDETLTLPDSLALTLKDCPGPGGEVEAAVLRALVSGATYVVEGRALRVTAPDGTAGLVYRAG